MLKSNAIFNLLVLGFCAFSLHVIHTAPHYNGLLLVGWATFAGLQLLRLYSHPTDHKTNIHKHAGVRGLLRGLHAKRHRSHKITAEQVLEDTSFFILLVMALLSLAVIDFSPVFPVEGIALICTAALMFWSVQTLRLGRILRITATFSFASMYLWSVIPLITQHITQPTATWHPSHAHIVSTLFAASIGCLLCGKIWHCHRRIYAYLTIAGLICAATLGPEMSALSIMSLTLLLSICYVELGKCKKPKDHIWTGQTKILLDY